MSYVVRKSQEERDESYQSLVSQVAVESKRLQDWVDRWNALKTITTDSAEVAELDTLNAQLVTDTKRILSIS